MVGMTNTVIVLRKLTLAPIAPVRRIQCKTPAAVSLVKDDNIARLLQNWVVIRGVARSCRNERNSITNAAQRVAAQYCKDGQSYENSLALKSQAPIIYSLPEQGVSALAK